MFKKLKDVIVFAPKNLAEILGGLLTVCGSALLFFHSEWQINLMTDPYVWGKAIDVITKMQE